MDGALVAGPQGQELVRRCLTLAEKLVKNVEDTHKSYVTSESFKELNSPENAKLVIMKSRMGIPSTPALRPPSDNTTLESSLKNISEGLQLHRALLSAISSHLDHQETVAALSSNIKDLLLQIHKVLKLVGGGAVPASTAPVSLSVSGEYEVQAATHLILVQLRAFGCDVKDHLRTLDQSSEDTER